jgi:hypothetical protein
MVFDTARFLEIGLEIIDPNEKAPDVEDAKGQEG